MAMTFNQICYPPASKKLVNKRLTLRNLFYPPEIIDAIVESLILFLSPMMML